MKYLITGIHGFVGKNLVLYLSRNKDCRIYGIDIVAPYVDGVEKTYSWIDLDNGVVPPVDAIIHLAGKAHDTKNKAEAKVYFEINTGLTQKIFDYYLRSGAKKFVFFSTVKAAANSVVGILTEDVLPTPRGPYGESKIKAEEYIKSMFNIDLAESQNCKSVYILRSCMIHGPGNKGNLNLLYSLVSRGIPWPLGAFDNKRTFTSVENVCFAVKRLVECNVASGIYNVGDDDPISTNELVSIMCNELGKKVRIWKINTRLVNVVARIGEILHLPFNIERLRKLTEDYVVSNEKIKAAIGVNKMPIDAMEGLRKTIRSFR